MRDDSTPATKADLEALRVEFRGEMRSLKEQITDQITASEKEVKRHFDVCTEQLVHDFKGIFKDRLEQHEERITRLERAVRIIS